MAATKQQIIEALKKSYFMELETVLNYLANSLHLDGVRAEAIKKALQADIQEELTHATQLGSSLDLHFNQKSMQPPADSTDVVTVIRGVLAAEEEAISQYKALIKLTDGEDYVTQDLVITLLSDEEAHRQQFEGYLKEYTKP
ncbi:MAG TPA: ferritin-like domain-containing protein [Gemmatales bacterium]|nr:ferritin-like domain-containing protein [Gemmatales bacterium]